MNGKRIVIAIGIASVFSLFCAYGTSTVDIPGFDVTIPYLLTIFYARVLIGIFIGISEDISPLKSKYKDAVVRGGLFGIIASIVIAFYGGAAMFIGAGIVYGILTDVIATRFS